MPDTKRPAAEDGATARRVLLDGLARDADISQLVTELAPLHPRDDTFPGEVFLRIAADALGFLQLTDYGATPRRIGELTAAAAGFSRCPWSIGCGWTTGCRSAGIEVRGALRCRGRRGIMTTSDIQGGAALRTRRRWCGSMPGCPGSR